MSLRRDDPALLPQESPGGVSSTPQPRAAAPAVIDGEYAARVLRSRAEDLAQPPALAEDETDTMEVVEFRLGTEAYAIESSCLREVQHLKDLTPIPGAPPAVLGLINLRGQVILVVHVKVIFDMPDQGGDVTGKVLIVRATNDEVGFFVEAVAGVRMLNRRDLLPPLSTLTGVHASYVQGMTRDRLVLLDAARILTDERIA